jgi:SpoVK/Ycf46/Vps4 family AAA+-type ATPase
MSDLEKDLVHLVRLALEGKKEDVAALARRTLRQVAERRPDLVDDITIVLRSSNSVTRGAERPTAHTAVPVDLDSRLQLLRRYEASAPFDDLHWPEAVEQHLHRVLAEREHERELQDVGLTPTRSMLFVGPPGVGKTLAARWLATQIARPLLVLDLSAVMSSFLGRTGGNIRAVLDYAQSFPSVLLLDEFDAIAKRRDDATEIGELKRLVTVLLQTVDDWPAHSLLIAATNHPELLDPAVWRRFEQVVEFPLPTSEDICSLISKSMNTDDDGVDPLALSVILRGSSFADVARLLTAARRAAVLSKVSPSEALIGLLQEVTSHADKNEKLGLASELARVQMSQRDISALTGLSRDTIRKRLGTGAKLKPSTKTTRKES